jgi:hypothetical protein
MPSDLERQIRDSIHEAGHAVYAAKNEIIVLNSVTIHPQSAAEYKLRHEFFFEGHQTGLGLRINRSTRAAPSITPSPVQGSQPAELL